MDMAAAGKPAAGQPGIGRLLGITGMMAAFGTCVWFWAGQSAWAKCAVSCGVILPFVAGGGFSLLAGCVFTERRGGRGSAARMDATIISGWALGIVCSSALSAGVCRLLCRLYNASFCVVPSQVILPGMLFAGISSAIVYIWAFMDCGEGA